MHVYIRYLLTIIYLPYSCRGFFNAYLTTREFVHETIRKELSEELGDILVTGHSLGGALASLCAYDLQIHTLAIINKELKMVGRGLGRRRFRELHLSLYSYGSPKVGNETFVTLYNQTVPDTFRYEVVTYNSN